MKALIKDNEPYCPECEVELTNTPSDVDLVVVEGKKYFQFKRRCGKCGKTYCYLEDLEFDSRFTTDKAIKKVKDSGDIKNKGSEE